MSNTGCTCPVQRKNAPFRPQCAMVFHNLRLWRSIYVDSPYLPPQFCQCWETSSPLNRALFGPITILQKDLAWINCQLTIRDAITLGRISMTEPNKGKFGHFIRALLRNKLVEQLQQKHEKWSRVIKVDIDTTTCLVRKLQPDSPLRVPLIRTFADARATPHKLHKMGIFPTAHFMALSQISKCQRKLAISSSAAYKLACLCRNSSDLHP